MEVINGKMSEDQRERKISDADAERVLTELTAEVEWKIREQRGSGQLFHLVCGLCGSDRRAE